jgi:hypothetical protein
MGTRTILADLKGRAVSLPSTLALVLAEHQLAMRSMLSNRHGAAEMFLADLGLPQPDDLLA